MANKFILAVALAVGLVVSAFAAEEIGKTENEGAKITVKGILHEDKNGFFLKVDKAIYDIRINNESKADMHKFYTSLEGDMVKISGVLRVEEAGDKKDKYLVLYTDDIARLKGERVPVVEQPVVEREVYVEHPTNSFHIPGVLHINW
jgi:hypothetical protein